MLQRGRTSFRGQAGSTNLGQKGIQVKHKMISRKNGIKLVSLVATMLGASLAQAVPVLDLGAASAYSGFFFGNVTQHSDIEGRMAVKGNLTIDSISVGYRNPYGSTGPSVVVGGNVNVKDGAIYNGPKDSSINTNLSIGPDSAHWVGAGTVTGTGIYGGSNLGNTSLGFSKGDTAAINKLFADSANYFTSFQQSLASQASTGKISTTNWDITLSGATKSTTPQVHFFNISDNNLKQLTLDKNSFGSKDWIVVNLTASGTIKFASDYAGSNLDSFKDRLLFNVVNAQSIELQYGHGSLVAPKADILAASSGHWEGNVVANNNYSTIEIGYEPFVPTSPVPEPETYAMLLAGLGAISFVARRRKAS
ncbi:collagen-binding domain-containing protein [Paucibacter sp. AS339]|uniref:collagen-binding domain-containing protein n=1 Tax=Paucibacter hankyongi TaxID=3133434 RepID=UPI0030A223DC